jgi:hypothetical protein
MPAGLPRLLSLTVACLGLGASPLTGAADASRWSVAGGIGLGSDYRALIEGRANHNIEVSGWRPDEKREVGFTWILAGSEGGDAMPPLVREYRIKVFDGPVYLEGEADGEGKLHVVFFRQKGNIDVDAAIAKTIERFGEPDTRSGGSMQWGSCATGPCADVDITPARMEVRLQDASAQERWNRTYQDRKTGSRELAF